MLILLTVIICLGLNAVLSLAEMAFVTIDKKELQRSVLRGSRRAKMLKKMHQAPERILSVIQIGITLVGAASAAVSGAGAEEHLRPILLELGVSHNFSEVLALLLVILPITVLSVIVGELIPKSIAIRFSWKICFALAPALKISEKFLGFLVTPLEKITRFLVELFFPKAKPFGEQTSNDISLNGLRSDHQEYVHNLIQLNSISAESEMIPWHQVEVISSVSSSEEVQEFTTAKGHTRFPVIEGDEVYGFLHYKDFVQLQNAGIGDNWLSFIRPAIFIEPKTDLFTAFNLMKKNRVQILFVGSRDNPLGILTLEDVFEEVVGDIVDENEDRKIIGFLRHRIIKRRNDKRHLS